MIKLSRKVEYGLISLLHIASIENKTLVTCREISEQFHIPPEILGKVLQTLTKNDLIESIKGVKGGYRLCRGLAEIAVGEVIEALDGPIHLTPCSCENYICIQKPNCMIREPVFHFQDQLTKFVFSLSLESFREKN